MPRHIHTHVHATCSMLCYALLCFAMLCFALLCCFLSPNSRRWTQAASFFFLSVFPSLRRPKKEKAASPPRTRTSNEATKKLSFLPPLLSLSHSAQCVCVCEACVRDGWMSSKANSCLLPLLVQTDSYYPSLPWHATPSSSMPVAVVVIVESTCRTFLPPFLSLVTHSLSRRKSAASKRPSWPKGRPTSSSRPIEKVALSRRLQTNKTR